MNSETIWSEFLQLAQTLEPFTALVPQCLKVACHHWFVLYLDFFISPPGTLSRPSSTTCTTWGWRWVRCRRRRRRTRSSSRRPPRQTPEKKYYGVCFPGNGTHQFLSNIFSMFQPHWSKTNPSRNTPAIWLFTFVILKLQIYFGPILKEFFSVI